MPKAIFRTMAEQVANGIREDIRNGLLEEDALLREQDLSDRYGVSRGTVRHALMQLANDGIVIATPNIGMRVASHPTKAGFELIVDLRTRVEDQIMKVVWKDLRANHMTCWHKNLSQMEVVVENGDKAVFSHADRDFHGFFVELYPDPHVRDLWIAIMSRVTMLHSALSDLAAAYEEHCRIYNAIDKGDIKGALALLKSNVRVR